VASFDVQAVLADVSPDAPCGENLEYDPAYTEVMRLAEGTPERQVGDSIVPAEEPDWRDVQSRLLELLGRTKDLQLGVLLALASLRVDGLAGFRSGLEVVHGLIDRHWDEVHPQLDPEDDNDPTQRVMILDALGKAPGTFGDPWRFLDRLRDCPLTNSRQLGRFTMRQVLQAEGELSVHEGEDRPDAAVIDGAFQDTPLEDLQSTHEAARAGAELARRLEQTLTERVGAGNATDLSALPKSIEEIARRVERELSKRGASVDGGAEAPVEDGAVEGEPSEGGAAPLTGEITNRQGVLLALDKVCRYYEQHEPSSPVPLLVKRAKRLVSMPFMEIIRDLSPESLERIQTISGNEESGQQ